MTSWTESSAGSASANNSAASSAASDASPYSSGVFIGMDEAGYGPNLGPLLITTTRWRTPDHPRRCPFYELLQPIIDVAGTHRGTRLHIADSKVVFTGRDGFRSLETSALALLASLGRYPTTFHELWQAVSLEPCQQELLPSWYQSDIALPVIASKDQIRSLADQLQQQMQLSSVQLEDIQSDVVIEERFNTLTRAYDSKGLTLSRLTFQLMRRVWTAQIHEPTLIVGDKHGGRNRYDDLLAEILDGEMIFRLEESRARSCYRINQTEIQFQVSGESHLPVACASIISKYLRELAMDLINRFWEQHCPGLRPTRGYPSDAKRYRQAIEAVRCQLNIPEDHFWRYR